MQRAGRPRPLVAMEGGALLGVTAAHCAELGTGEKLGSVFHFSVTIPEIVETWYDLRKG